MGAETGVPGSAETNAGAEGADPREPGRRRGLPGTFLALWGGQVISLLGSGLTAFALGVWVVEETGSVTAFALLSLSILVPGTIVSPLAGPLVDRWDRRRTMIGADAVAGATTVGIALLLFLGRLEIWHLYVLLGVASVAGAFQTPAFTASTTLLVAKRHFARASAMSQMGQALSQVLAPVVAGALLAAIGLSGIVLVDAVTFLVAVAVLLALRIPRPRRPGPGGGEPGDGEGDAGGAAAEAAGIVAEAREGWRYLRERRGLFALLVLFACANFALGGVQVLLTPLVLSFASAETLGWVLTVAATGMLAGSLAVSVWGGPRRKVRTILFVLAVQGLILLLGGLEPSAVLVAGAAFVFLFGGPFTMSSSQALWQAKIPPHLQGRIFALRRMTALSSLPLAYLTVGPLADRVFEPALAPGGALAGSVGRVLGVGPGRGLGLMIALLGIFLGIAALAASRYRPLVRVEEEVPDVVGDEPEEGEAQTGKEDGAGR